MVTLSIIDIGSNTVHLLIIDITNKDKLHILYEDKEHLRLGSELALNKKISHIKIAETIVVLKKYLHISNSFRPSNIIAVATEALRVAENSHYILDLIKNKIGLHIKLLSAKEEAYFSYLGVKNVYNIHKGIIVDSGGASTEFIGVRDNNFVTTSSIHLGSINVTEKISTNNSGQYLSCAYTKNYFDEIFFNITWLKNFQNSTLIGIGGTFKNLRSIYMNLYTPNNHKNLLTELSTSDLLFLCSHLGSLSTTERKQLKGLSPKRCDIILGGCEIISNIIDHLNFNKIILTDEGLRTGILYNYIEETLKISNLSVETPKSSYQ